ncbi:MAG: hypothetical protein ACYDEN_06490 [Acidimicrobiales bacterium]
MGKASSSKKVARVAGIGGGRTNRSRRSWGYRTLIAVVVVVGVALTYTSRQGYINRVHNATVANAQVQPKVGGTPWNEGYGVWICGKWAPPIKRSVTTTGISTAGNGVIHIAPKIAAAAGRNATLGEFATSVGMTLSGNQVQLPRGKDYVNGNNCGSQPAEVYVKQYAFVGAPTGVVLAQDPRAVRLQDQALVTIAFVPRSEKGKIPPPPASVQGALQKAATPPTTTTLPPATTVPSTTTKGSTSSTTTKGSTSSTTTKGSTSSTTTKASGTTPTTAKKTS